MGGLHDGHSALLRAARHECAAVIATLFVNPSQFETVQDAVTYPHDEAADLRRFADEGVDLAFVPPAQDIYPPGFATQVCAPRLSAVLEGASRPGHFDGVATVVTLLLNLTRPARSYFGQKDWQQTRVVRQVVDDLTLGVDLRVVGTVRDASGLALGTRNVRLTAEGRRAAQALYRALTVGAGAWRQGERQAEHLEQAMRRELEAEPGVSADYAVARHPLTLGDLDPAARGVALLVAAWVEGVRLIDNLVLGDGLVDIDPAPLLGRRRACRWRQSPGDGVTVKSEAPQAATIGTAGHVDHGKSTLVHALTGIDPDRLAEEKARGMTIDLGFAWLTLPSGRSVSLVDVPGHERFIHNMLAGVGGIDACLFVVAADEGVMPQTREHLDIVTLLGIDRGVVALAKTDLVDEEWLDLVQEEVREALAASSLARAPIVPVSARLHSGLEALLATLDEVLAQPRSRLHTGGPRLPVDRAFSQRGFGTVVTGTLAGGPLGVGDVVHLYPGGARTRVRGLQTHRAAAERALPGRRVAVNLGGVTPTEVPRGTVVAAPGAVTETRRVDATLRLLPSSPRALKPGERVAWHSGTAEVVAALRYLEADPIQPGAAGWVQWRLGAAVALRKGDPYVIRRLSPPMTIGGGEIVRAAARHVPRGDPGALEALERARRAAPAELVAAAVEAAGPLTPEEIARRTELTLDIVTACVDDAQRQGGLSVVGGYVAVPAAIETLSQRIRSLLAPRAGRPALPGGLVQAALPQRLGAPAPLVATLLARLAAEGRLVLKDGRVLPPGSAPPPDGAEAARLLAALDEGGFAPPDLPALGASTEFLDALAATGQLVRITPTFGLTRAGYARWRRAIGEAFAANERVTVSQLRDQLGTSRKYVLAFPGASGRPRRNPAGWRGPHPAGP